ncbi:hypothetical protein I5R65_21880 [Herbaspirillum sp. AP02]|uniref:hypothetical protein n=1 Tax=unclassified Herbaspirillum TaxID=2624150 RepID=UPI0015DB463C|nr:MULTISPECIES: hypothetical protein [unclassified Herbaspirillum]MBG7622131.1 hypothetical protein [Herbaspirillum sp. AP02]NZD69150.1 hypothetical protein [Herbaspirillum sp. AP21]HCF4814945.1 hypothetical protein [Pseudomonas aeruginosa]
MGPSLIGYVKAQGHSAGTGLMFLSGLLLIAFLMTVFIRIKEDRGVVAPDLRTAGPK